MIAFCKQCGKRYLVDENAVKGMKARFNCKFCGNLVLVEKHEQKLRNRGQFSDNSSNLPLVKTQEMDDQALKDPVSEPAQPSSNDFLFLEKNKSSGFSLVTKVIGMMLIVSLVPLCTVWWIIFKQVSLQIRQDTENLIDQVRSDLIVNVDEWIDKNIRILNAMSELQGMASMDPLSQTPLLKTIQKQYPWTYLAFTTDSQGMNIARSDDKALKNYSDRQYYKDVVAGNDLAWQVLIGKSSGKPALVLAVPIVRDGLTVGVLATAMTIDDISKRVANWKRGATGFAFLVDETGKVVAHPKEEFALEQKDLSTHPLIHRFADGKIGTAYFKDENGTFFVGNVHGTKHGWALAVQQSEQEAFGPLRKAQRFVIIVFIITILAVVLIAWFIGRAIVKPIKKLTEAAERISVGELDVELKINSNDEIAALGRAIVRMQDSIRLSMERFRRRKLSS